MSALILVVDDEEDLLSTLEYNLEREGYQVRTATDGETALSRAAEEPVPNLVLLDLMLPDMPGTEICRKLRQQESTRNVPVIMITAKAEEIDRVVGFEVGADDYVTKPFSTRELLLRVRAVLRRAVPADEEAPPANTEVTFGRLRIDESAHRVWVDDSEITLTALEFKLLNFFLGRKGRVQTRDTLLNDVWGIQADVATRTVDTHVKRLRQKLGSAGTYIETLRGVGYRFRPQPNEAPSAA